MAIIDENPVLFENRKSDHIRLALHESMQASGGSGFDQVCLEHEALPDLDFNDISISPSVFGTEFATKNDAKNGAKNDAKNGAKIGADLKSPLFISSMTAGHAGSRNLNLVMARVAEKRGWAMGVGSQRRQLSELDADEEWREIRKQCPKTKFFGNIGLAQLIHAEISQVRRLVDSLSAHAMIVHLNPLQECMQPEGTPQFKGGLSAIERLVKELGVPVIVKETGCGFSERTLNRLNGIGLYAVDISGFGGTHWGRIEGGRAQLDATRSRAAESFRNWGISTVESLRTALSISSDYQVWASGGVRSGLDAAKAIAMGASLVGIAQPIIAAALQGEAALDARMELFEYELKTAMFCTGSGNLKELQERKTWEAEEKI